MNAVASRNIKFISHCDQGGRGDGVQVMVHRGFAYIGHGFSNGITIVDVRDPKYPKTVNFLACPPNTRAHHIQTHGDLLLAVNGPSIWTMQVNEKAYFSGSSADALKGQDAPFTTGLRIYDLSRPEAPREIAFMPTDGMGPHRIWYVGGRYAYLSIHFAEFSDHVLAIVDMAEPTRPQVVGKYWLPACGRAAAKRRAGPRAGATRCIMRWSPATSPTAPGATAALRYSMSAIRPGRGCCATAIGIRRSAAAPTRRCRCRTAICWWWRMRPISPTAASDCAISGFSTSACQPIR